MQVGANASYYDKAISVTPLVLHIQRKRSNKYEFFYESMAKSFAVL